MSRPTSLPKSEILTALRLIGGNIIREEEKQNAYRLASEGLLRLGISAPGEPLEGKLTDRGREMLRIELQRIGLWKSVKFLACLLWARLLR